MKKIISWFRQNFSLRKSYQITGGRKFREDEIYCFCTEKRYYGVLKKNELGEYEEILAPIYNSTVYKESADLLIAVKYKDNDYKLGKNTHFIFQSDGKLVTKIPDIDYLISDSRGNIFISKDQKVGLLSADYKSLWIDCEYEKLSALSKEVFKAQKFDKILKPVYKAWNHTFNGIVNSKNQILGNFDFSHEIYGDVYLDMVILGQQGTKDFFTYHLKSKEKKALPYDEIFESDDGFYYDATPLYRTVSKATYNDDFPYAITSTSMVNYVAGKWGVIYPNGEVLLPNEYDYLEQISAHYFKVAMGKIEVLEDEEENELTLKNLKWGVVDLNNTIVLDIKFDWISINEKKNKFLSNRGGEIKWNARQHKPEWEIHGGIDEVFIIDDML